MSTRRRATVVVGVCAAAATTAVGVRLAVGGATTLGDIRHRLDSVRVPADARLLSSRETDNCFHGCPDIHRYYSSTEPGSQLVRQIEERLTAAGYRRVTLPPPDISPGWRLGPATVVVQDPTGRQLDGIPTPGAGSSVVLVEADARG